VTPRRRSPKNLPTIATRTIATITPTMNSSHALLKISPATTSDAMPIGW